MKTNIPATVSAVTHEGGKAAGHITPKAQLLRQASTCMLWENTFYESGSEIATGLAASCASAKPVDVVEVSRRCRTDLKLRHVPLFLLAQLARPKAKPGRLLSDALADVIQRPDEMGEFLSIYAKVYGYTPKTLKGHLPNAVKRGLARAFTKFSAYQLAKWDRAAGVTLKDVMFLVHPKPKDEAQAALWKSLIDGSLAAPDTWEVALSSGADKKETFTRLLTDNKLGYMALLANLRNMIDAGVDQSVIRERLIGNAKGSRALPFRFLTAAKHAPALADALSEAMIGAVEGHLGDMTYVIIDVSGSMDKKLAGKSQTARVDAAAGLAILVREVSASCRVFTFSESLVEVPTLRGLALSQCISASQPHGGTYLRAALDRLTELPRPDRAIVITDEQTHDGLGPAIADRAYIVNVASYQPGLEVGGGWTRINGWSERVVDWIQQDETADQ